MKLGQIGGTLLGYSVRGKPALLLATGEHVSVITALSVEGILCCKIIRGNVNGEAFVEFIENQLMPAF